MRKKKETDNPILVILSKEEFDQIQEFIESIGFDTTHIKNGFCRDPYTEEVYPKINKNPLETPNSECLSYDIQSKRSITSLNKDEKFFKNSTISDEYLTQFVGSKFTMNIKDRLKMASFIYDELGFPENHLINWNSPLVGLLVSYSKTNS
jgi:hypothetical protein